MLYVCEQNLQFSLLLNERESFPMAKATREITQEERTASTL